jgi:hypothetical protein
MLAGAKMADLVKKLTDLFGRSKSSAMSRVSLGLEPTQNPNVKKILDEMPRPNRQTGLEEKYRNDWNNQGNKQETVDDEKKLEEEMKNDEEQNGEEDKDKQLEKKKPNIFEKLQDFITPQSTYVSHIVKRHMERRASIKVAFDNPDPSVDNQDLDKDTRLLDPENPEYKRKKGFGKPYGDVQDGGELKCNVPAMATIGIEHFALSDEELAKYTRLFSKVTDWKPFVSKTVGRIFPKNYFNFVGTHGKDIFNVIIRSQDTYDEGAFEKPYQVQLMKKVKDANLLLGQYPVKIVTFFNTPDDVKKFVGEMGVPMDDIKFSKIEPLDMVKKKLEDCEMSGDLDKKTKHFKVAVGYSKDIEEGRQMVVDFIKSQFARTQGNAWEKRLFELISGDDAPVLPEGMTEDIVIKHYDNLGFDEPRVLDMGFSREVQRKFVDTVMPKLSPEKRRTLVQDLFDNHPEVYTSEEMDDMYKKYLPDDYNIKKLKDKARSKGYQFFKTDYVNDVKKLLEAVKNNTQPWQDFKKLTETKRKVKKSDLVNFFKAVGMNTTSYKDILDIDKKEFNAEELNGLFGVIGERLDELKTFYTDNKKKITTLNKMRDDFSKNYTKHGGQDTDYIMEHMKEKRQAEDKINQFIKDNNLDQVHQDYYLMMQDVDKGVGVPQWKVVKFFKSLSSYYNNKLLFRTSLQDMIYKDTFTPSEIDQLLEFFGNAVEKVPKFEEKKQKETGRYQEMNKPMIEKTEKEIKELTDKQEKTDKDKEALEKKKEDLKKLKTTKYKPFAYKTDLGINLPGAQANRMQVYLKYDPQYMPVPPEVVEEYLQSHKTYTGIMSKECISYATVGYLTVPTYGTMWVVEEIQSDMVQKAGTKLPDELKGLYASQIQNYYADWAEVTIRQVISLAKENNVKVLYVRTPEGGIWNGGQGYLKNILTTVAKGEISEEDAESDLYYRIYKTKVADPLAKRDKNGNLKVVKSGDLKAFIEAKAPQMASTVKNFFGTDSYFVIDLASVDPGMLLARKINLMTKYSRVVKAEVDEATVESWKKKLVEMIEGYIPRRVEEKYMGENMIGKSGKTADELTAMVNSDEIKLFHQEMFWYWWDGNDLRLHHNMPERTCPDEMKWDGDSIKKIVLFLQDMGYSVVMPGQLSDYMKAQGKEISEEDIS